MNHALPSILLVDDDEGHLMVAKRAIARSNLDVEVFVAHSGVEALRRLGLDAQDGPPIGLVLVMLDLSMPGVSGWEVLRQIRQSDRAQRVPVVVVSSSDRPDDVRRSYELGANSYLVKRFEAERPGGYLADAARYWVELNEAPSSSGRRPGLA
jgi:CheY-like chemotaxis protein